MKVHVKVGLTDDNPSYTIEGKAHIVAKVLNKLGFIFQYTEDNGALIFRDDRGYRARYTQVQDHNPKEDHHS